MRPVGGVDPALRVLHVVESLGSGVATAIGAYLNLTPRCEHLMLGAPREAAYTGGWLEQRANVRELPSGRPLAQWLAVRRAIKEWQPDVVHAHSSWGGVLARTQPALRRGRIIYTPHCFAFERTDLPGWARRVLRLAEQVLAHRTGHYLANGRHEARLATGLAASARVSTVLVTPWAADTVSLLSMAKRRTEAVSARAPLDVVTAGRIVPQKGVPFLIDAVRKAAATPGGDQLRWTWLGGGAEGLTADLRGAGVHVTGWLPRPEVMDRLVEADVYVHTAAWEAGCPLTVLEAGWVGLPLVLRGIEPLADLPVALPSTPGAMAAAVLDLRDLGRLTAARAASCALVTEMQERADPTALARLYADRAHAVETRRGWRSALNRRAA